MTGAARRLRTLARWATDWRNGATLAATILVSLLAFVVADAAQGRDQAFEALEQQTEQLRLARAAASRRIDLLTAQIHELETRGEANAELLGTLVAEVEALRAQVRQLGAEPVVAAPAGDVASRSPASTTSTTSTTARPPPSPTTTTTVPPAPGPGPDPPAPEPEPPGPPVVCRVLPFVPVVCS